MNSISFIFCSFLYSILLMIVYFKKKENTGKINKIYSALIVSNFIGLILEMANYFTVGIVSDFPVINLIVSKLYLIYLLTWVLLLTFYTFVISYKADNKSPEKAKLDYVRTKKMFLIFYVIYALVVIFLPISFSSKKGAIYSYGLSVQSIFVVSELCIALCWIFMLRNAKNIRSKKYAPLFIFFVGGLLIMLVQSSHPEMLLSTSMETFVTFLIYFTVEDKEAVKKINEDEK